MNFSRFGLFGLVVLTLAALLNVAALYTAERGFAELRDAAKWVRHTQDAGNQIAHIYRRTVDAETGQRGYLLTQDADVPQPVRRCPRRDAEGPRRRWASSPRTIRSRSRNSPRSGNCCDSRFDADGGLAQALSATAATTRLRDFLLSHQGMVTMSSLRLALDGMADGGKDAIRATDPGCSPTIRTRCAAGSCCWSGSISSSSRWARSS